jgi:CubicO group peptidase (beta-lactamase class C family)
LLIQKVTGRTPAEEITNRIIQPLGLTGTYYPETGDKWINGAHVRGYAGALGINLDVTGAEPFNGRVSKWTHADSNPGSPTRAYHVSQYFGSL